MMKTVASLLLLLTIQGTLALRICSFNAKCSVGSTKGRRDPMDILVRIITRCDIMLLMEIEDNNNMICPTLMNRLNGEELVSVKKTNFYQDSKRVDVSPGEPYAVWFQSPNTAVKDFVIVSLHTKATTPAEEMDELSALCTDLQSRWKAKNFVFMGNFNAGCSYVPQKGVKAMPFMADPSFVWLIGDNQDTTVKKSNGCAYDRIVLKGQEIVRSVVPRSNSTFNFQKAYELTEEEALAVSEHLPVEFQLQSSRALTKG
ncbi:deoxyribonuclease gamma-like [Cynocephalus volans]|uniref:deoxyribonuclease gamma-like n=1 Tax=Cynocephalus volans TaxID=110931 RepID=UPI002FCCB4C6